MDRYGERTYQINRCNSSTRRCVNLFKQWNYFWHSSCTWSHHLVKLMKIHRHPPRFICHLTDQIGKLNGDVVEITTPASFKSLIIALIFAIPPGMQYCFWFTIFLDRDSSNGFHLLFPTRIAFTPQVRKPMWGLCHLSLSIPMMHCGAGEITTGWVWGPTGPAVRWTGTKIPFITWPPKAPTSRPQWYFGSLGIKSELVSSSSWNVWLFPFPHYTVTLKKKKKKPIGPFGGRLEKD